MSTVRVKRKHVLDSDSDESEDEPAPGAKAQIARSDAETRVSEEARGGECASPPGPSEPQPQQRHLLSAWRVKRERQVSAPRLHLCTSSSACSPARAATPATSYHHHSYYHYYHPHCYYYYISAPRRRATCSPARA